MNCPRCGTEMNHHADKVDYVSATTSDEPIDMELGGVLQEIHTCPKCRNIEMRATALESRSS
jgi:ribosomal protein S27AE